MLKENVNIEKRNAVKKNLIKAGIIGAGVVGLSGIVNASSTYWIDQDGTETDLKSSGGTGTDIETIGVTIGNGTDTILTGLKGYFTIPYGGTIKSWYLTSEQASGSIVIDIWKANASIPTIANTITASAKPTLTTQQLANNSTLTGWTTSVSVGDVIAYNVDSVTAIRRITLALNIEKA